MNKGKIHKFIIGEESMKEAYEYIECVFDMHRSMIGSSGYCGSKVKGTQT